MAKIYTKVGDAGQTSLIGGRKVAKSDGRIQAYGTVDELNSALGLARSEIDRLLKDPNRDVNALANLSADLEKLQHWLFDLGSLLAAEPGDREKYKLPVITTGHVQFLEGRIDAATALLKPLKNFILPGGSELASRLHLARTIARRAERLMVENQAALPENSMPFINRVSDYLFTMARDANRLLGITDVEWKPAQP